ncbi:Ser/Thr protein kinase RdoA (MazF antagonist) [Rhodovulum iodosum]|uniref:Ser/Thr protein kinase RdoA (MazF antagonist) n=1 Tax=Rhodovulum iodosum TaxID=68291 RepID=A0ABV3XPK6_9RHOB|nr:phosphotransferase [Rhodovulum robiginosum]RSK31453.1 hypothetical protein EJA01_15045 [Rhodovulum robiginosum]
MPRRAPGLSQLLDATERLAEIQARRPAIARFEPEEALKAGSQNALFRGHLEGRPAVLKLALGRGAKARTRAARDELTYQYPRMREGQFRVPEPLAFYPGEGVAIMAVVPGTRLDKALAGAPAAGRAALIAQAGGWLAHYAAPRRGASPLRPGFWLTRSQRLIDQLSTGSAVRRTASQLEARLRALAPALDHRPVVKARSHGDFCALNLHVDGAVLYGLDIQNSHRLSLAKDVARFLVCAEMTAPAPDGPWQDGLATADRAALLGTPELAAAMTPEALLPFFIGVELIDRLVNERAHPESRPQIQAAAGRYLAAR